MVFQLVYGYTVKPAGKDDFMELFGENNAFMQRARIPGLFIVDKIPIRE